MMPLDPAEWERISVLPKCLRVSLTWKHPVFAAPGSSAEPPSWPSPPRRRASFPPTLCTGPPGFSSFARGVVPAEEHMEEKQHRCLQQLQKCIPITDVGLSECDGKMEGECWRAVSAHCTGLEWTLTSASESFSFCFFSLTLSSKTCSISASIFFIFMTCSLRSSSIWARGLLE